MRPNEDGVYRWRYSLNLYRNAVLLWLFYKVFSCVFAVCVLFGLWLNDFKFSLEATKWALVGYAAMIVLVTVSYYFYALIQGGRYTWDFEMDENGVNAVQVANEAKRNKVRVTCPNKPVAMLSKEFFVLEYSFTCMKMWLFPTPSLFPWGGKKKKRGQMPLGSCLPLG